MSAYPQRIEPGRPPASRGKPKAVKREPGIYDGKSREEVLEIVYESKWNGDAELADFPRVCRGVIQFAILQAIFLKSNGGPCRKGEKPRRYTPVLSSESLALLFDCSEQAVREEVAALTAQGFILHLGEDGSDYWRMALNYEAIRAARKAFSPREGAFGRKPVQSERGTADQEPVEEKGDRKAKAIEDKGTYDQPRATAIARPSASPQPLPPETATVVAEPEEHSRVELINSLPYPVDMTRTVTRGNIQIHLTSPGSLGEPPAGTRSQPEPSALAGAGRVRQPVSAALNSNGTERVPGALVDTPFTARAAESLNLAERLAALGIACEDRDLAIVRRDLRCDPEYFLASVTERVANSKSGKKIGNRLLPHLVASANEKWGNGGKKKWTESRAELDRNRQLRCGCGGEIMDAQTGLCWQCAGRHPA